VRVSESHSPAKQDYWDVVFHILNDALKNLPMMKLPENGP